MDRRKNQRSTKRTLTGLGVLALALTIGFVALDRRLQGIPISLDSSAEHARLIAEIEAGSGLDVPDGTKVLLASKDDARNPGSTYWILFSPSILHLPGSLARAGDVYPPDLHGSVRTIEKEIFPFRISRPKEIKDYSWSHENFRLSAIVIEAELGSYTELLAVRQD